MKYIGEQIKQAGSFLIVALMLAIAVSAQSNTGTITGQIQDANGAIVANATVTITNVGTNETRTVQTNAEGFYEAPSLSTGVYKVTAQASGFQETTVSDARLAVGSRLRVDVQLGVSGVSAVVQVQQTATDTETATVGDTITAERISDVPINGRDFTGLLSSIPGSVQTSNQFQTSVNGIPSTFGGASVLVDGIDAGRVDTNGTSNVLGRIESRINRVSIDSIQEIQVVESNYSAQYGNALSAVINPITKSGTNEFHGSVFDYFRNEALDANDFFANRVGFPRAKFRLNQFGGNLSGPIIKDKLFFFANYEGVRQTRGTLFNSLVPTAAFRATFAPAVRPLIATLPLPNQRLVQNGVTNTQLGIYSAQLNGKLREDTGSVKFDYNYSDRSRFSLRYNLNDSNTTTPYGIASDQIADGKLRVQLFKLSNNYILSNNAVNELAFGINRNLTNPSAGPSTFPIISFAFGDQSIANLGPAQFNQFRTGTVFQFLDTLSFVRGNHSFKTGADIRLNRRTARSETQQTLQFASITDFRDNVPFIVSRSGNPTLGYENENFSFFFQDDWKAHPRLTLNLGLRYEVSTVSREQYGRFQNFDLATRRFTPIGQKFLEADKNNFAPRVGFAFDVFGDQKTVLRGGYGIFYNQELPASFGSPQANTFRTQSVDLFTALFVCGIFPQYPVKESDFACSVPSAYAIENKISTAYAQQWNLNVQQNVGVGILQVGYVGNHVLHLLTNGVISPRNVNRANAAGVRPIAGFGDIFAVGGYPQSNYNALQVTFKRNLNRGLRFNANYTWAHAIDDAIGFFKDYQDPNNTRADRASSDQDIRHNFTFDASYDVPSFNRIFNTDGIPRWIGEGWQLNTLTQIRTGFPVNVTLQGGTFGGFTTRPNLVPNVSTRCPTYNLPDCQFNAAAFSVPANGGFGNLGRNALRGPSFSQVDFSVFKNTQLTENTALQLRIEFFNIFNNVNFADPSGGLIQPDVNSLRPSAFFGQSISTVGNQLGGLLGAGGPRQIQLSARFNF